MSTIKQDEIREAVQDRYGRIADTFQISQSSSCCEPTTADSGCCEPSFYTTDLTNLPESVTGLSLGCGDPIAIAALQPGQTVLDLGSGAGIDCFLAAERVGPTGRVIGVDMTPSMLEKAQQNKAKLGVAHVEFREGRIESLPVEDNSIDVIISNCVINLSPDKTAVFQEAYRVLKPGGRLAVSDMVTLGQFTEAHRADAAAWSECITGAEPVDTVVSIMQAVGFQEISIVDKADPTFELAELEEAASEVKLLSARITAVK